MREKTILINKIFYDHVLNTDADIIVQVGGRYSGKSFGMEQLATINLATKTKYKMLMIEDKEGNVNQGTKSGILSRISEFEYDNIFTNTKQPAEINSELTDNKALFKGYTTEDQVKQVKALNEITSIWYEEAENISKEQIEDLYFQLRGGDPKDRKLYLTLNPVNSDSYINKEMIQGEITKVLEYFEGTTRPKVFEKIITTEFNYNNKIYKIDLKYLIVITTHHDNKFLEVKQRAAIEALKLTDYQKWLQLAEARFIKSDGAYFKEFDRGTHVIDPFVIPNSWDRYCVLDYGLDMLAVLWIAVDNYGKSFIYREYNESDLIISKAAEKVLELEQGENITIHYGPGDLWNRRQETGKSAWDIFAENGLTLIKSDRNRINGCFATKEWLHKYATKDEQTGKEKESSDLKMFNSCTTLINNLSEIETDEKDANVYSNTPHILTHIIDALRYYCIMRIAPSVENSKHKSIDKEFFNTKEDTSETLAGNFY